MARTPDKDGYLKVIFHVAGKIHTKYVHRVVCEAFHGPAPVGSPEVDHIDRNRANAAASNLTWVSRSENLMGMNRSGERNPFSRLTESQARLIKRSHREPLELLAATYGVRPGTIRDIQKGRRWAHVQ